MREYRQNNRTLWTLKFTNLKKTKASIACSSVLMYLWGCQCITFTWGSVLSASVRSKHNPHDPITSLRMQVRLPSLPCPALPCPALPCPATHSFIDRGYARSIIFDATGDLELNSMTRHVKFRGAAAVHHCYSCWLIAAVFAFPTM